jgi:hypothetical protein
MPAAPSKGLPSYLLTLALLSGLASLPAMAQEEPPPPRERSPVVALDLGGTLGALRHPAAVLPPTPNGLPRSLSSRGGAVARVTFGANLALSQFLNVEDLWETNVLDWYIAGDLRIFSLRVGVEQEIPLSRRFALALTVQGAAAEVSMGTGQLVSNAPPPVDEPLGPDTVEELRATRWLFGASGAVSLIVFARGPLYLRTHVGYTQYIGKADRLEAQGQNFAPTGFSVQLSGPSAGVALGVRL